MEHFPPAPFAGSDAVPPREPADDAAPPRPGDDGRGRRFYSHHELFQDWTVTDEAAPRPALPPDPPIAADAARDARQAFVRRDSGSRARRADPAVSTCFPSAGRRPAAPGARFRRSRRASRRPTTTAWLRGRRSAVDVGETTKTATTARRRRRRRRRDDDDDGGKTMRRRRDDDDGGETTTTGARRTARRDGETTTTTTGARLTARSRPGSTPPQRRPCRSR